MSDSAARDARHSPGGWATGFPERERRLMLAEPGIGPLVLDRLEREGIHSLAQLRETGVAQAVLAVCTSVGSIAFANRRRALERALARGLGGGFDSRR
jgi:hypothetical protein